MSSSRPTTVTLDPIRRIVAPSTPASGQTLGRGVDFALVIFVFFGIGALVDRWLGTWPGVAIGLVLFSVVGQFVSMYYRYKAEMEVHEAERRARQAASAQRQPSPDAAPPASGSTRA